LDIISRSYKTQLVMRRKNLDNLPDINIPAGFTIRDFLDGDEGAWNAMVGDMCKEGFDQAIRNHRFFKPERVKMICYNGSPVSSTIAWGDEGGDETLGMVHMVATNLYFRGKGLGFCAVTAALRQMKAEGKTAAYLTTDDWRLPAIKIYLKLGFEPDLTQEGHTERWENLYKILNKTTGMTKPGYEI